MKPNGFKIAAKSADKGVMLKWDEVPGADGYRVYMKKDGEFKGIRNVKETSIKLTGLENGELYTFLIKATNGGAAAAESEPVSCAPLGAPSDLTAESGDETVFLSWGAAENAYSYRVYISDGSESEKGKFSAYMYSGAESCAVRGLKNKKNYKFKVRACKFAEGTEYYGGFSGVVSAVPAEDAMAVIPAHLHIEPGQRGGFICAAPGASWKSSDENVATVDGLGAVVGVGNGSARITVTAKNGKTSHAGVTVGRESPKSREPLPLPRYSGKNGVLSPRNHTARIIIAGDVMCLSEQQEAKGARGDYSGCFDPSREIIAGADYSIGTLVYEYSPRKPSARDCPFAGGARNYNAPPAFIEAVRGAGFDCVASVLPVSGETGSELIRCGVNYTDINEKGRVIAEINGIKTAFVTFRFDGATAVLNPADIVSVKNEGADFIIALCRWGVADSHMVRDNQRAVAERLAAFGADCVVGGGPGVIQGNAVFSTEDGRDVPVFYSLGNFITSVSELPANRDSCLLSLTLRKARHDDSDAKIADIKLIPCTVADNFKGCAYAAVPLEGENAPAFLSAVKRVNAVLGPEFALPQEASDAGETLSARPEGEEPEPDESDYTPAAPEETRARLIGSRVIEEIVSEMDGVTVSSSLIGVSALTVTEIPEVGDEWLIVDFYGAATIPAGGVNPSVKESFWKARMDKFTEAVKAAYPPYRVILISHRLNRFYAVQKQVRLFGEAPGDGDRATKLSRIIKRLEDYFIEKVNPVVIDVAKEYFAAGADAPCYDSFFSEHARRVLNGIFNGETEPVLYADIWLKRYLYYYDSLVLRKLSPFVLNDRECAADIIAEKSSKEFIREYSDELIEIKQAGLSTENVLELSGRYGREFINGVKAIKAAAQGDFDESGKVFSVMFDRSFEILGELIKPVYNGIREFFPDFDAIITKQTLPFYFKLLRFARKAKAAGESLVGADEALREYSFSSSPLEVDVWGTEISYISAMLCNKTAVRNYIEKNPFCWAFTEPIAHTEEMFEPVASFMGSEEYRDAFKNSFDRKAGEIIANSNSRWLVADFFDLAYEMAAYKGGFFEIDEFTRRTVFFNDIKKECKFFRYFKNYDKETAQKALDKMIDAVAGKYGGNIILNRVSPAEYYIDFDDEVKPLSVDKDYVEGTAAVIAECERYFIEKTDCYVIDISGYFMSDERYPRGGANIGNYEDMFYKNTALFMSNIFRGKDDVKVYDRINPVYRLMKMIEHG
ncbi:MAG: CapA family protein [Oscillospiraceae bacterium]|jgi:hypothetical protein|nr:CapA family protein [Oscillospiraceae bacterium]